MPALRAIRADYTRNTFTVYQAYDDRIADAALAAGTFVPPFSSRRMTWIKPSFLWLMARSQWGRRSGQTRILAVRLSLFGWSAALSEAVLTAYDPRAHENPEAWSEAFEAAPIHAQWDPERSLRGSKQEWRSLQIGVSRRRIEDYTGSWIRGIEDLTPRVRKMHDLLRRGRTAEARRHLPTERLWHPPASIARRLSMDSP